MKTRILLIGRLVSLFALYGCQRSEEPVTRTVPLIFIEEFPCVEVSIGGSEVTLLIDTGASSVVIIDSRKSGTMKLPPASRKKFQAEFKKATVPVKRYHDVPMTLGGKEYVLSSLDEIDLSVSMPDHLLPIIGGLLGTNFLKANRAVIDLDNGELLLHKPGAEPSGKEAVPLDFPDGKPWVDVSIGGREMLFLVDTGSNVTDVIPRHIETMNLPPPCDEIQSAVIDGETIEIKHFHNVPIAIGERDYPLGRLGENPWFERMYEEEMPEADGILGSDFLKAQGSVIDYGGRKMLLPADLHE
ncbi:MAG: aspartyl protease family protein [Verrucomicrobiota bacterium]